MTREPPTQKKEIRVYFRSWSNYNEPQRVFSVKWFWGWQQQLRPWDSLAVDLIGFSGHPSGEGLGFRVYGLGFQQTRIPYNLRLGFRAWGKGFLGVVLRQTLNR